VNSVSDSEGKVDQMRGAQTGLFILAVLIGIILGIIFVCCEVYLLLRCGNQEKRDKLKKVFKVRKPVNYCCKLIQLPILIWVSLRVTLGCDRQ
jgi:6-phosphogluconate dehydrogenase